MPKIIIDNKRKYRNISDYIYNTLNRITTEIELIAFIKRNKDKLMQKEEFRIILSMCDVYSRDIIIMLNHILDEDLKTSSLFSMIEGIKAIRKKKKLKEELKKIKKDLSGLVRSRNNQVGHFNTELNIIENGYSHINHGFMLMRPRDTKKIIKQLTEFYWNIKEEAKIDGLLIFHHKNTLRESFQDLLKADLILK